MYSPYRERLEALILISTSFLLVSSVQAHRVSQQHILIIDDRNSVPLNLEKPMVNIYNPRLMDDDWLFRLDGKRVCFELKDQVRLRRNRFSAAA